MKKSIFVFLFVFLFAISLVLAADSNSPTSPTPASANPLNDSIKVLPDSANIGNLGQGLNDKTEDLLDRNITLSPAQSEIARIVFSFQNGMSWQKLILLLGLWVFMFIVIFGAMRMMPFIQGKILQIIASLIVMVLISISGGLNSVLTLYQEFVNFFNFVEISWLRAIISVAFLIIIAIYLFKLSNYGRNKIKIAQAKKLGEDLSKGAKSANVFSEGVKDLANDSKD